MRSLISFAIGLSLGVAVSALAVEGDDLTLPFGSGYTEPLQQWEAIERIDRERSLLNRYEPLPLLPRDPC